LGRKIQVTTHRSIDIRWIGFLNINAKRAEEAHRVRLQKGKSAWTLIFVGPRIREWGFYTDNGWIEHEAYQKKNL
jgi:hypothetical protein